MKSSYPANFTHAHKEAQDGPSSERDRHQHLYRTLRGPSEVAPREGRDVRGRIGRKVGDTQGNALQLGIGILLSNYRATAKSRRCTWYRSAYSLAEKIISRLWCRIFKVLETFFGKNLEFSIFPLDLSRKLDYTNHTTIERVAYSENSKTRYPIIHDSLCCLRHGVRMDTENPCTSVGHALENPGSPISFVLVSI